ncbi:hypothetical protein [Streptomyces milbemycinicus]|uniref:hypothetical protein n=1 Tax=Streptomyces milbemycinicus TaxID=476552 RepID=UPI003F4CE1E1
MRPTGGRGEAGTDGSTEGRRGNTVGLHVWRRNALLSILGGTTLSVILASTVLAH